MFGDTATPLAKKGYYVTAQTNIKLLSIWNAKNKQQIFLTRYGKNILITYSADKLVSIAESAEKLAKEKP